MDEEIRRTVPEDRDAVLALAGETLGWGSDDRFPAFFTWKHRDNPFGESPAWVALADGEVVGFRTLLRWRFRKADGAVAEAVRAVDTATHPRAQGRGIFTKLTLAAVDALTLEGFDFVFNTPNDKSRPGYMKMGWMELGRPPVAVTPRIRSIPKVARSRTAAAFWSESTDVGKWAPDFFRDSSNTELAIGRERYDDRWRTDRSPDWCAWRYGLPTLNYRVLTTGDLPHGDRLEDGAVVFRLRRRGHAIEATVVDVMATTRRSRARLLRAVLSSTGADYLLAASDRMVDATPSVSASMLGPLVTWRQLATTTPPRLAQFGFELGDLELF